MVFIHPAKIVDHVIHDLTTITGDVEFFLAHSGPKFSFRSKIVALAAIVAVVRPVADIHNAN
jgi:hypothetical protein